MVLVGFQSEGTFPPTLTAGPAHQTGLGERTHERRSYLHPDDVRHPADLRLPVLAAEMPAEGELSHTLASTSLCLHRCQLIGGGEPRRRCTPTALKSTRGALAFCSFEAVKLLFHIFCFSLHQNTTLSKIHL